MQNKSDCGEYIGGGVNRLKLWELNFRHYAPKDSKEGIVCYLVAETLLVPQ